MFMYLHHVLYHLVFVSSHGRIYAAVLVSFGLSTACTEKVSANCASSEGPTTTNFLEDGSGFAVNVSFPKQWIFLNINCMGLSFEYIIYIIYICNYFSFLLDGNQRVLVMFNRDISRKENLRCRPVQASAGPPKYPRSDWRCRQV